MLLCVIVKIMLESDSFSPFLEYKLAEDCVQVERLIIMRSYLLYVLPHFIFSPVEVGCACVLSPQRCQQIIVGHGRKGERSLEFAVVARDGTLAYLLIA